MDEDRNIDQLAPMRADLKLRPDELNLEKLIPIVTPASFYSLGNWPGPYLTMGDLGITWAVLGANETMLYVNTATSKYWENQGVNWRERATENLAKVTGKIPATHQYNNENGEPFALAFMQTDGCGPSRLLLHDLISRYLTEEYEIAVPEMSLGIALRSSATDTERTKISELITTCFGQGTRPVTDKFYSSKQFQDCLKGLNPTTVKGFH